MKHKQILKESSIADVHESILINILILLPLQCIIRCRFVCKSWATLIVQPYFIEYYDSTKYSSLVQLLIEDRSLFLKPNNLFLAQLDEAECTANSPADFLIFNKTRFSLKFLYDLPDPSSYLLKVFSACSVTGCIAAYRCDGKDFISVISCHIFNPVTGQHILVDDTASRHRWWACALLYVPKTNQFKFLYFHPLGLNREEVEVDIQTIGTNSWRSMGRIPFFYPAQRQLPTYVNGLYHWIDPRRHIIYSFNAEEEVFEQIQTPPRIKYFMSSNLGLLNGCLCICMKSYIIELWVMSEFGDEKSWTKKFVLYNLEIVPDGIIEPLKCLENGEIVILCFPRHAICYNSTTRSRKYIRFGDKESIRYVPFSYSPSLRKLLRLP